MPNWRWLPVGYHGRSSTVVVSGTPVRRPHGQRPPADPRRRSAPRSGWTSSSSSASSPATGPPLGEPLRDRARRGRDLRRRAGQRLERARHPALGVPAARPVPGQVVRDVDGRVGRRRWRRSSRTACPQREQDPPPLAYLRTDEPWALDIDLEVELNGDGRSAAPTPRGLYWTMAQQLAHATVNGANVRAGDLYASGHDLRPRSRDLRLAARAELGRAGPGGAARRRRADVPRGRRHAGPARRAGGGDDHARRRGRDGAARTVTGSFDWRDGERTIHFGRGRLAEAVDLLGGPGYTLLTTERAQARGAARRRGGRRASTTSPPAGSTRSPASCSAPSTAT